MKNADLIKELAQKPVVSITQAQAKDVLKGLAEIIADDVLTSGNTIVIPGLGTFKQVTTPARVGRNPKTGDSIDIPERTKIAFKMSSSLKD